MSPSPDLGLSCRLGGDFYVCNNSTTRFIGCCAHDPCTSKFTSPGTNNSVDPTSGHCNPGDLRPASFAASAYDAILPQDCAASLSNNNASSSAWWYTCAGTEIPFLGCCAENPCSSTLTGAPCLQADLIPAVLSENATNAAVFLGTDADSGGGQDPGKSGDSHNGTDHNGTAGGDQQGGTNYLPMQLGIGVGALVVIIIAVAWTIYWNKRQKRKKLQKGLSTETQGQEGLEVGLAPLVKSNLPASSPKLLYNRYSDMNVSHDIGAFDDPRPAPSPSSPPSPFTPPIRTHPQPYTGSTNIANMARWVLREDK